MATFDEQLENPEAARGFFYFEAIEALGAMLDADAKCPPDKRSGWDDVFTMIRRLAAKRSADVIVLGLDEQRAAHRRLATQQRIADGWTDHADEMVRAKEAAL